MKYVYMLRAGEQYYKVGIASNIYNRIKSIQTSNPSKVEIVTANLVKDPVPLERSLHKWLQEFKADGGQEWFKLTDSQALELSIKLNNTKSVDLADYITLQNIASMQSGLIREFSKIRMYAKAGALLVAPKPIQESISSVNRIEKESIVDDTDIVKEATQIVKREERASTSLLQRKMRIGYGRASRIMDKLEEQGIISPSDGTNQARKILV